MNEYGSISHSGVLGMRWGIRRYQNPDGTLTEEGKRRYGVGNSEGRQIENQIKDQEAKKNKVKKILAIAGGITLAAATGYLAYKVGKQWTGNLQKEFQSQAKKKANEALFNRLTAEKYARQDRFSAKMLSDKIRREGQNPMESKSFHLLVNNARAYGKEARMMKALESQYTNLGSSVTRSQAVKNYIRNHRQIVV